MGNYTTIMSENPRRGRQARNFAKKMFRKLGAPANRLYQKLQLTLTWISKKLAQPLAS